MSADADHRRPASQSDRAWPPGGNRRTPRPPGADLPRVGPPGGRHGRQIARATGRGNPRPARHDPRRGKRHVNAILATPMEVRLAVLFVVGACVGSLVNLGVYRLGWRRRAISPWSPPDRPRAAAAAAGPRADPRLARAPPRGRPARRRVLGAAHAGGTGPRRRAWPRSINGRSAARDCCRPVSLATRPRTCRPCCTANTSPTRR